MTLIHVVVPIFNDWDSFAYLLRDLDRALAPTGWRAAVTAVDDGSHTRFDPAGLEGEGLERIAGLEILRLGCNLGHQKAIAVGLAHLARRPEVERIVVMDGDGEDDPAEVPHLLAALDPRTAPIALGHRFKRSEGLVFRSFYVVYKALFRRLTGFGLSYGNFCAMTAAAARQLTFMPMLWNSLPATALRSKLPYASVPTIRATRYAGEPKMNFIALILHGLHAITVFSDAVMARLSVAASMAFVVCTLAVVLVRLAHSSWIVPGWASNMVGFLVISLITVLFSLLTASLLSLQARSAMPMIPLHHADQYVDGITTVRP